MADTFAVGRRASAGGQDSGRSRRSAAGDSFPVRPPTGSPDVPAETGLAAATCPSGGCGQALGAFLAPPAKWRSPAPASGPCSIDLVDGSTVTYSWYHFINQPSQQGFGWSDAEKAKLQAVVEKLRAVWGTTPQFMAPPSFGRLTTLDGGPAGDPPKGLEIGYLPIVL